MTVGERWVRQLVLLVLLAGLAEALLPRGEVSRYAETVRGLLLLLAVLQPVLGLVREGFPGERALALDPAGGPGGAGGGDRLREVQRSLVLDAVRHQAERRVRQVVEEMPGVERARAAVRVEADPGGADYGRIVGVDVAVTVRDGRRLEEADVREAVRAELGLPPDRGRVRLAGKGGESDGERRR